MSFFNIFRKRTKTFAFFNVVSQKDVLLYTEIEGITNIVGNGNKLLRISERIF